MNEFTDTLTMIEKISFFEMNLEQKESLDDCDKVDKKIEK